jgi:DNA uptake protein ComE-like DNA-binding protein
MTKSLIREKLLHAAKDYLTFSRSEQRGIFVLLVILFGLVVANRVIPGSSTHPLIDFRPFEKEIILFEEEWQRAKNREQRSRGNHYSSRDTVFQRSGKPGGGFVIELNAADTFDLQRLRGVGPSFARRIVGYRKRLGGYIRKEQLMEVFGMDSSRYAAILPNITVLRDSVHRIDLNNITFKELLKHPYFPFELTKAILVYRQKNKKFTSLEDLKNVVGVSDSVFRRVIPYLRIDP